MRGAVTVAVLALAAGCGGAERGIGPSASTATTATRPTVSRSTTFPTVNVPALPTSTTLPPLVAEDIKPPDVAYTVVAGDAWYVVAQKLRIQLQDLLDANGMTISSPLYPGMQLKVPPAKPTTSGATTTTMVAIVGKYTVESGDYWAGIASKLGVALGDLLKVNKASTETVLLPGKQVNVPAKRRR